MKQIEVARVICTVTYNAYRACLMGSPTPIIERLYKDMQDVKPGRMVMETTTHRMANRSPLDGLGTLLRIAQEKVAFSDPEFVWNEKEEGRPHPTETVYYIETLDGREYRWHNASFIAIPDQDQSQLYR